jgi:hypothetical protein
MRILTLNLLAVALLLFGASSASAFAINWAARGATTSLTTSDTVTVDVFLDAEDGLALLSVGVLFPNDGSLTYTGGAAPGSGPGANYPISGATNGAQASYLLYSPANMTAMTPAVTIYPQQSPEWLYWTGTLPPGQQQVNINYADATITGSAASGTGIYIATLVFHVEPGLTSSALQLSLTSGGNILQQYATILDPSEVTLGAPIVISGVPVPEPTTAALIGLGILGLAMAGRRRA